MESNQDTSTNSGTPAPSSTPPTTLSDGKYPDKHERYKAKEERHEHKEYYGESYGWMNGKEAKAAFEKDIDKYAKEQPLKYRHARVAEAFRNYRKFRSSSV